MTTTREIFMYELTRLLAEYERCDDEQVKREIYLDITLLKQVIFEGETKKNNHDDEANQPALDIGQVNKITE